MSERETPNTSPPHEQQRRLDALLQSFAEYLISHPPNNVVTYSADTRPTIARWTVNKFKATEHFGRLNNNMQSEAQGED